MEYLLGLDSDPIIKRNWEEIILSSIIYLKIYLLVIPSIALWYVCPSIR